MLDHDSCLDSEVALGTRSHFVCVPKETGKGETRVAATPDSVKRLAKYGFDIHIEEGAGLSAGFRDEDYDAALVEARRITVDTTRIASESFPMAIPPEEAERRCRRALMEAWIGRESATFRLPPSRLALDPAARTLRDIDTPADLG